jgi:prepilin-type N-terminal cleavage/methylation domain-containing protein
MNRRALLPRYAKAFSLLELLVVIAILGILAALLLSVLSRAKASGKRTSCLNNLKQIAAGVHMYADASNQILFPIVNTFEPFFSPLAFYEWTAYDPLMRSYVGLKGAPSPQDKLFACPADTFYYWVTNGGSFLVRQSQDLQSNASFSSYAFNAGNAVFRIPKQRFPGMIPGIMGSKLSSIAIPAKTVLVAEFPALDGFSWHLPTPQWEGLEWYNNAPNMISFVDGHVSYVKMYSGSNNPSQSLQAPFIFNPPAGYDYQWSGD